MVPQESPKGRLEVPDVRTFRGPSGDIPGTSCAGWDNDKRLQIFDKITTYPYRTYTFKVCESEMMIVRNFFVRDYKDCQFYYEAISTRNKHIQSMLKRNIK